MKTETKKIILAIVSVIAVAAFGSLFVALGQKWFQRLITPTQFVPDFVIPIVWTAIYGSCAVILALWIKSGGIPKDVLALFCVNGVLNVLWCLVFFTLKQTLLGTVVIVVNAYFGVYLIAAISKYKPLYAKILTLYPLWLLVATALNLCLWILN